MSRIYRIRVKNHLDSYWTHWFDGMKLTNLENGEAELMGPVEDQAGLHRLLDKIRDLNLGLTSVERVEETNEK